MGEIGRDPQSGRIFSNLYEFIIYLFWLEGSERCEIKLQNFYILGTTSVCPLFDAVWIVSEGYLHGFMFPKCSHDWEDAQKIQKKI